MTWGCDTIETCEPATSVIVAPARSAMLRCVSGGITLSSVPMTAQLGSVFQRRAPEGVVLAPRVIGRCPADDQPAVRFGQVLGEGLVHRVGLQERLGVALGRARVADDVEDGRRIGDVERRPRPARGSGRPSRPRPG